MSKFHFSIFCVLMLSTSAAFAAGDTPAKEAPAPAPAAPVYEPITLTAADINEVTGYVGKLPYSEAMPLMNWLQQKESQAQAEAAKAKDPKK